MLLQLPSYGQIVPDATLPISSVVTQSEAIYEITAGTVNGRNLFHSFDEFSLPDGQVAFFNNESTIDRIITRVTGGDRSIIDGILQANGEADFFFLNPKGIVFGPNARLDIGGSFISSTAEHIEFADGSIFSASAPLSSPLLTVSVPIGLQYGNRLGAIAIQGEGNALSFNADTFVIDRSQRPDGLAVDVGETLAVVGGGVSLTGGNVTAPNGRIELGSVDANQFVDLRELETGWELSYDNVAQFQDIRLSQAASVDVSGVGSGDVQVQANQLRLSGGSSILANTQGVGQGGQIVIAADDKIVVNGFFASENKTPLFPSSIIVGLEADATGSGGNLELQSPILRVIDGGIVTTNNVGLGSAGTLSVIASERIQLRGGIPDLEFSGGLVADVYDAGDGGAIALTTGQLQVEGGAEISASTFAVGDSGSVTITADEVDVLSGAAFLGASSILTSVQPDASGKAGDLRIATGQLTISGGATTLSITSGAGEGGDVTVSAKTIDISGVSPLGNPSGLFSDTDESNGQGGNLIIDTQTLIVSGGAEISTASFQDGDAGNLAITAESIQVTGISSQGNPSGLFTSTNQGLGDGGILSINTQTLQVLDGAEVASTTFSSGRAGNMNLVAETIDLVGNRRGDSTGLFAAASASGIGGDLSVQAQRLRVLDGAQVVVGTEGAGDAGSMLIDVPEILLSGTDGQGRSGLFANAIIGTGTGGEIEINTDSLRIQSGATINASNFASSNTRVLPGRGPAGDIIINSRSLQLREDGSITTSTAAGDRGNIVLNSDSLTVLRDRSTITTDALGSAPGGNITIDTGALVGAGNSDITANAINEKGGRILITADNIFGFQVGDLNNPSQFSTNDITASSQLGPAFNGVIQLNTPDADSAQLVVRLSEDVVDQSTLVGAVCTLDQQEDSLVLVGRGGLPTSPHQLFDDGQPWVDLRLVDQLDPHGPERYGLNHSDGENGTEAIRAPYRDSNILTHSPLSDQPPSPRGITEAAGWIKTPSGKIAFVPSRDLFMAGIEVHCTELKERS